MTEIASSSLNLFAVLTFLVSCRSANVLSTILHRSLRFKRSSRRVYFIFAARRQREYPAFTLSTSTAVSNRLQVHSQEHRRLSLGTILSSLLITALRLQITVTRIVKTCVCALSPLQLTLQTRKILHSKSATWAHICVSNWMDDIGSMKTRRSRSSALLFYSTTEGIIFYRVLGRESERDLAHVC